MARTVMLNIMSPRVARESDARPGPYQNLNFDALKIRSERLDSQTDEHSQNNGWCGFTPSMVMFLGLVPMWCSTCSGMLPWR